MLRLVLAIVVVGQVASSRPAAADCTDGGDGDPAGASRIEGHLDREARRARRWDLTWGITYSALTVGQLGLVAAEWVPRRPFDDNVRAALVMGAGKTTIGALARFILPIKVARPVRGGAGCVEPAAALAALDKTAAHERRTFILNLAGGLALNIAGLVILGTVFDDWQEGAISFGLGLPVALLSVITQPRGSWKAVRRGETWHVGLERRGDYAGVAVGTTF
jgi:hypothetical protein